MVTDIVNPVEGGVSFAGALVDMTRYDANAWLRVLVRVVITVAT